MNNLNSILIEGNLVKDPLLRSTPKGTQVCTLRLASNRYYKLDSGYEREVTFVDVDAWARHQLRWEPQRSWCWQG